MTKRDWLHVGCENGHDMQMIGGRNAGCHDDCSCSVPVSKCSRCPHCDYGDTAEAIEIKLACFLRWGTPEERFSERRNPA